MTLRSLVVYLSITLVAVPPFVCRNAEAQQEHATNESAKQMVPDRKSKRGDYDIEHYKIKKHDLLQIKMRGTYEVVGVEEENLLLKPLPNQKGLLNGVWKVPVGRSHMGNHHRIVIDGLNVKEQTATVALEYKERWHWWDINF